MRKPALGLFGPVPARVSAGTGLEPLGLIDSAVADGWAHARACRVLDLADSRAHHWRARLRDAGSLEDQVPGGGAVWIVLSDGKPLVVTPALGEATDDPPSWELITPDGLALEFGPGLRWQISPADAAPPKT